MCIIFIEAKQLKNFAYADKGIPIRALVNTYKNLLISSFNQRFGEFRSKTWILTATIYMTKALGCVHLYFKYDLMQQGFGYLFNYFILLSSIHGHYI